MSAFGVAWLAHAGAAVLGLAAAGVVLAAALGLCRKRPVLGYRLAGLVLAGALVLPLVQVLAARLALGDVLRASAASAARGLGDELAAVVSEPAAQAVVPAPEAAVPEPFGPPSLALLGWLAATGPIDAQRSAERTPEPLAELRAAAPVRGTPAAGATGARLAALAPWIAALHAAGVLVCLARSLVRLARTRGVLRRSRAVGARTAPELDRLWRTLAARSPVGSRVALRASDELASPACFGGRRPAVLLPARDVERRCDVARLRCVLVHELVHLERNDSRAMLLQELFRALFWFHPVAWWLARELDRLREVSCDWIAVRRSGRDRGRVRRYASALLDYAERGAARPAGACGSHGAALVGRPSSSSQLRRRIDMLIALEGRPERRAPRVALSLSVLALSAAWGVQTAAAAVWSPQRAPLPPAEIASASEAQHVLGHDPAPALEALAQLGYTAPHGVVTAYQEPAPPAALMSALRSLGGVGERELALSGTPRLGIALEPVGAALAAQLGRDAEGLLLVAGVVPGSLAERAGLERFDVLFDVDGAPATNDALTRAKQRLGAAGSLQLGLLRRGTPQRQQVGPFGADVLEQSQAALRAADERSGSGAWVAPTPSVARAPAPYAERGAARGLFDEARAYYERIDGERFGADLRDALKVYGELEARGGLDERTRAHRDHVQRIVEGGRYQEYVESMRKRLRAMSPQQFEEQIARPLSELDPAVRRSIEQRWRGHADGAQVGTDARGAAGSTLFGGQVEARDGEDLARALRQAREQMARQAQELERLRERLEELERRGGGER